VSLLDAVRKACPSGIWSQGVKLAREGAVSVEAQSDNEVTLRVRAPRLAVPPTVVLYPNDEEWTCDCAGKIDPCEHVVAATIALSQGTSPSGEVAPKPAAPKAHVGYRLVRQNQSLYLQRAIVPDNGPEQPLRGPLASVVAKGGPLLPTHEDLAFDRVVGPQPRVFLPVVRMPEILGLLASAGDVTLDGAPVKCSGDLVTPRAIVRDTESGVALRIERDPAIQDVVGRGVVRIAGVLRPMAEVELTGDLLQELPRVRPFPPERFPELVTEVLPALEDRLSVVVESKRLPRRARAVKPRVMLELSQPMRSAEDAALSIVPFIVYGDPPQARIDDGKLVHLGGEIPVRDEAAEKKLLARLREDLDLVPGRRVDFLGRDALRFAARLKAWAVHDPEQTILASQALTPKIQADGEHFEVSFETADGTRHASSTAVMRAWEEGLDIVPLDGGGWAPLPADWLQKHGKRLADLLAARDEEGKVARSAATLVARVCEALEQPAPPSFAGLAAALDNFERIPKADLPADLQATLRAYQRTGVDWLSFLRDSQLGAVLADDMGLGKTLQTIAALRGRTLVVAPRSVIHNWAAELAKFRPNLRVALYHGPKRALDPSADVTLTTYAVMRLDLDTLKRQAWDIVVLDEAQAIKNPDSQVARAAYQLNASFRIALSGTPVENRLEELWSVFHFANRGLLGGRSDFKERYSTPLEEGAAARLRERIRPFLLRRLKKEVAPELPPRTDIVLHVELEESERAVYDAVRAAAKKDVIDKLEAGGNVLAALEALLRLRQAACHSALVPGQKADTSSKVETLVEALSDAASEGHKALVFSQWTAMLDRIEPHLEGIPFVRLDGSTNDRAGVVAKFQADDGPPVMLVSLKAGGTGLNLTAADHVFLVDPWWNPAVEDQAADRAHRIGQDKPVFVYRLVAKDTVEEGILALQEKKRAIADAALAAGDHAGGITREELLALLA